MHSRAPGHVTCRLLFPTISAIVSRNNRKIVYLYKYAIIYPVTEFTCFNSNCNNSEDIFVAKTTQYDNSKDVLFV